MQLREVLKSIVIVLLSALCMWQGYLAVGAHEMAEVMHEFNNGEGMAVFIIYSQPLIWLFLLLTALIAMDIFRRKDFLIVNSFGVALALAVGTVFLQLFVVVGGYAPIFELGNTQ